MGQLRHRGRGDGEARLRAAVTVALALALVSGLHAKPALPPLFDCKSADARYVLQASADGSLALEIETRPAAGGGTSTRLRSWHEIRTGWVGGQQGGHQSHLRLSDGRRSLVLYEGEDGSLAERPGRTYAGVMEAGVEGLTDARLLAECEASATNRSLLDSVRRLRQAAGVPDFPEEIDGGPFDGWF